MQTNFLLNYLSIYPIILGTVGAPHELATNIRHSSHSSALLTALLSFKPVQSRMLYSHRFLCLPLLLPPRTVPWRTVLASPEALVTCSYHFILRLFTVDKTSSSGPMAFRILLLTSSLVMWSLYEMPRRCLKLLISTVCILLSISAVTVQVSQEYTKMDMTRERNSLIFELRSMFTELRNGLSCVSLCADACACACVRKKWFTVI